MDVMEGRCPRCGEIYRFQGDTVSCTHCNAPLKKEDDNQPIIIDEDDGYPD